MSNKKFIMMIGLPGSGKSTIARGLAEENDVVYLSSDDIRKELSGNEENQNINTEVFETMRKRTLQALNDGKHVVYDATNINSKKRKGLLTQLPKKVEKIAYYIATSYKNTLEQNSKRERIVPKEVIDRMYKTFQIPIYSEGWDKIITQYDIDVEDELNELPKQFTDAIRVGVLFGREGYEVMMFLSQFFDEFFDIYELSQDSKYHSFSVSRHTYYVYKYILDNYEGEDKELLLWTAILHDTGKAFCKSFVNRKGEETRYANFYGHENVGAQLAVNFLRKLNFSEEFIQEASTLIQFHMVLLDDKANKNKLKDKVGQGIFEKLEILRNADTKAH